MVKLHPYFVTRRFLYPKRWMHLHWLSANQPLHVLQDITDWADAVCINPASSAVQAGPWPVFKPIKVAYLFPMGALVGRATEFGSALYTAAEPYLWTIAGERYMLGDTHMVDPAHMDKWPKAYVNFLKRHKVDKNFDAVFLDWYSPVGIQTTLMERGLSLSDAHASAEQYGRMIRELAVAIKRGLDLPMIANGDWHRYTSRAHLYGKMYEHTPHGGSYFYTLFGWRDEDGAWLEHQRTWGNNPPVTILMDSAKALPADNAHLALSMVLGTWYAPYMETGEPYEFTTSSGWIPTSGVKRMIDYVGDQTFITLARRFRHPQENWSGMAHVVFRDNWQEIESWRLPWMQ